MLMEELVVVFFVSLLHYFLTLCFQSDDPDDAGALRPFPVVPTCLSRDPGCADTSATCLTLYATPPPPLPSNQPY